MNDNISEMLEKIKGYKEEEKELVQEMAQKKREYDASMKELQQKYGDICKKANEIGNMSVPTRLGDLLEEVCWLSKTNFEDVQVSLFTDVTVDGVYAMDEFLKFISNKSSCGMQFRLSNRDTTNNEEMTLFNYSNIIFFDLGSIQADGRTLLEHCSLVTKTRSNDVTYTSLVVDKDIEDVILPLTLNYVSLDSNAIWKPADLFSHAVINCDAKKQKSNKTYKRV